MIYFVLFKQQQQKFPHTTHITKGRGGIKGEIGEGKGREKERRGEIK